MTWQSSDNKQLELESIFANTLNIQKHVVHLGFLLIFPDTHIFLFASSTVSCYLSNLLRDAVFTVSYIL